MSYTFKDLAEEVLTLTKKPLTVSEIWSIALDKGFAGKLESTGKTPIKTLAARLYVDIKDNKDSVFSQISKRPALFVLKSKEKTYSQKAVEQAKEEILRDSSSDENTDSTTTNSLDNKKYNERDLHILLSSFVKSSPHFRCHTKTVYHESSKKEKKGKAQWVHPDMVGAYFPYEDYEESTLNLKKALKENSIKLFSFELKIKVDLANLRECFFQAVSNSSWANEGYLVALNISQEPDVIEELQRLNNSFGIGVIQLKPESIDQSEVLFFARENTRIDYNTIDRLAENNPDFKEFIDDVVKESEGFHKKLRGEYDKTLDDESARAYSIKKGIILK